MAAFLTWARPIINTPIARQCYAGAAPGKRIVAVVPAPSRLCSSIGQPKRSDKRRTRVRPTPWPSRVPAVAAEVWLEYLRQFVRAHADAAVLYADEISADQHPHLAASVYKQACGSDC